MSPEPENNDFEKIANQPYANRNLKHLFIMVVVVVGLGFFALSWFFKSPEAEPVSEQAVVVVAAPQQMPNNQYAAGTARSGLYDFFYKIFGGIKDGVENSPHNLKNIGYIEDNNLNAQEDLAQTNLVRSPEAIAEQSIENLTEINNEYRYSLADVIGGEVRDSNGTVAGNVYDVIINVETGEAKTIIMKEDGESLYDRDLAALNFKNIINQDSDGDIQMTITEGQIEGKKDFDYNAISDTKFLSLKNLRNGQLLDSDGKVAGEVDAIIYNNAQAQKIYFSLNPALSPSGGQSLTFGLPYDAIHIVQNPDGYDVKLTKEQTASLAQILYGDEQ